MAGLGWKALTPHRLCKVTRCSRALGSKVHLTLYAESLSKGEDAIDAALAAIERVEQVMSLYRKDSQLCQLNRVGAIENPDRQLLQVLEFAQELSLETRGSFDVTVQPLWKLHSENPYPSPAELAQVSKRIGWRKVLIEPYGIQLSDGAQITLNGIAQGYAADAARDVLIKHGIEHAILDTGEISTVGRHAEHEHWSVGIKHPRQAGLLEVTPLDGRCLATSGDYESAFSEDLKSHHLFDPRTGCSARTCASVSVMAPSAMQADAYSTACFVLGMERGMQLIEKNPKIDALFVSRDGERMRSSGFPSEIRSFS